MTSRIFSFVFCFFCFLASATAHDNWANGDPIPKWVKDTCCGPADAHRLDPSDVTDEPDGYHVKGYPKVIPHTSALPSQDGYYWIFYKEYYPGNFSPVYCFFIPLAG